MAVTVRTPATGPSFSIPINVASDKSERYITFDAVFDGTANHVSFDVTKAPFGADFVGGSIPVSVYAATTQLNGTNITPAKHYH